MLKNRQLALVSVILKHFSYTGVNNACLFNGHGEKLIFTLGFYIKKYAVHVIEILENKISR